MTLGRGFLAKFCKRSNFSEATLEKNYRIPDACLLQLPSVHLNVSGFMPTFLYVDKTQFQARTHHVTVENTEIMVIHD